MSETFLRPSDPLPVPDTLRARLRRELSGVHAALDQMAGQMDLDSHTGYVAFLKMNEAGLAALQGAGCAPGLAAMQTDLLARLRQDLAALGAAPLAQTGERRADLSPLALDYVLAGSRLGGAVLRQRWQAGALGRAGAPSAYMSAPDYLDLWRGFCAAARDLPATGAAADQVVTDAATLFDMFIRSAQAAIAGKSEVNA